MKCCRFPPWLAAGLLPFLFAWAHATTIIAPSFDRLVNSAEGERVAYAHHGSLSREIRADVEARLKAGELVAQWAGGGYGGNAVAIAGLGMTINLQTNLALGPMTPTGGEYELEAIEVKGEDDLIG